MDEIDWEILRLLQEDGRMSMTRLGKEVNLSIPAVKERVQKLEDKQVICGYRAVVEPKNIGKHMTAFVLMETSRCEDFRRFCAAHPAVMECHRLVGQYSYLVKVVVESIDVLETFIDEMMPYGNPSTLVNLSSPLTYKSLGKA